MSIALVALIIATGSLMWQVVSTVYSWKFSKPAIRVEARPNLDLAHGRSLAVNIINTGGSAIGIKEMQVCWWSYLKARSNTTWETWLWKLRNRLSKDAPPVSFSRIRCEPEGPDFLHTVPPYHDATWFFNLNPIRERWRNSRTRPKDIVIRVRLSNGKRIDHKVDAVGLFRQFGPIERKDSLAD